MNDFLESFLSFGADYSSVALVAIFIENIIFTRALGSSTSLYIIRKKYNLLTFGAIIVLMTTLSSILVYCVVDPFIDDLEYVYFLRPVIYVCVLGAIYIAAVIVMSLNKKTAAALPMVHLSAFNCAVLGALLLASQSNMHFEQFLGFGFGTGVGFVLATYLVSIGYEKFYSPSMPRVFRGMPLMFIYVGTLSLSFYGLIGRELPF